MSDQQYSFDDFEELDEDVESAELRETITVLKAFLNSPGWALYERMVLENRETLVKTVLSPLADTNAASLQEFRKGAAEGLRQAIELPRTSIDIMDNRIKQIQAKETTE